MLSPVTTRTRTETIIQPGTYGPISILEEPTTPVLGYARVAFARQLMTAAELRAAAATLTELAAGLEAIEKDRNEAK